MLNIVMLFIMLFGAIVPANPTEVYVVQGPSMSPALNADDRVAVDTGYYRSHEVERGDLIVYPASENRTYLKRVIALPGETIKIQNNKVYINEAELPEDYIQVDVEASNAEGITFNRNFPEFTVPAGTVFVMGDNRLNSYDSRLSGGVPIASIIGKVTKKLNKAK